MPSLPRQAFHSGLHWRQCVQTLGLNVSTTAPTDSSESQMPSGTWQKPRHPSSENGRYTQPTTSHKRHQSRQSWVCSLGPGPPFLPGTALKSKAQGATCSWASFIRYHWPGSGVQGHPDLIQCPLGMDSSSITPRRHLCCLVPCSCLDDMAQPQAQETTPRTAIFLKVVLL